MEEVGKYFSPDSFATLHAGEDNSWWFINRNSIILWAIEKYAAPFKKYLEIGCGTGFVLRAISAKHKAAEITGTEYFEEGLEIARSRIPGITLHRLDATQMAYTENFDLIGTFDVLEHIDEDELVLKNCFQALQNDSCIAITVPQHMWMWSAADEYACHVRRYTRNELSQKVSSAGFEVVLNTSFVSLLLPLMALNRYMSRNKPFDPRAEFEISRLTNTALGLVMKLEIVLLKCGVRFYSGGSILMIAKKR